VSKGENKVFFSVSIRLSVQASLMLELSLNWIITETVEVHFRTEHMFGTGFLEFLAKAHTECSRFSFIG